MFGVGRDLCGPSSPTPLPKQGHLQQAAQDCVQAGLEYLQRRRISYWLFPSGRMDEATLLWEREEKGV